MLCVSCVLAACGGTSGEVGYVGLVDLVEFRLRFLCGACGALVVMDGCILVLGRRGRRPYGRGRASPRPGVLASWRPV